MELLSQASSKRRWPAAGSISGRLPRLGGATLAQEARTPLL